MGNMVANLKDFLLRCFDCDLHGSSQRYVHFEDISLIYNTLLRKSPYFFDDLHG